MGKPLKITPWDWEQVMDGGGTPIACNFEVFGGDDGETHIATTDTAFKAITIAVAPELAAALKTMLSAYDDGTHPDDIVKAEIISAAKRALHKFEKGQKYISQQKIPE